MAKDRTKSKRGRRPRAKAATPFHPTTSDRTTNDATPKFCLAHIAAGHCLEPLTTIQRADFAMAIQKRCALTWSQITLANRHGLGLETIKAKQIKPQVPATFQDREKFLVLRYSGTLPMIGVRTLDVFHVLWIEGSYGEVYDH